MIKSLNDKERIELYEVLYGDYHLDVDSYVNLNERVNCRMLNDVIYINELEFDMNTEFMDAIKQVVSSYINDEYSMFRNWCNLIIFLVEREIKPIGWKCWDVSYLRDICILINYLYSENMRVSVNDIKAVFNIRYSVRKVIISKISDDYKREYGEEIDTDSLSEVDTISDVITSLSI